MSFTDPLELFRVALARLNDGDFLGAARYCDPVSLRAFQRQMIDRYAQLSAPRALTPDYFMRSDPTMPREVAEFEALRYAKQSATWLDISRELTGIDTLDALRAAHADVVFAQFLDGKSLQRAFSRMIAAGELTQGDLEASLAQNTHRHDLTPLAVVELSPTIGHILYRYTPYAPDADAHPAAARHLADEHARLAALPPDEQLLHAERSRDYAPSIASCRRQPDGSWLLLADHDFLGTGGGMIVSRADVDTENEDGAEGY